MCPALGLGLVDFRDLAPIGFACFRALLGGFDAADASPALPGLGDDQAHFGARVMSAAVVAVSLICWHGRVQECAATNAIMPLPAPFVPSCAKLAFRAGSVSARSSSG